MSLPSIVDLPREPETDPHRQIYNILTLIDARLSALERKPTLSWYDLGRVLGAVTLGVLAALNV